MFIEKIEIESFGKFKNFTLELKEGINVLYGENEAGKSTICAFLQAMFYDLPSSKQKYTLREDLRKRYMPWQGGDMSGAVHFSHDGKRYILKRRMGKTPRSTKLSLYDAETWEEIKDARKESPGEYFFGVGEDAFLKTLYISQLGAPIERGKNDEIIEKLSNLRQSGDEDISYQKTVEILTKKKYSLISVGGGAGKIIKLKEENDVLRFKLQKALENEAVYKRAIIRKTEEEEEKEKLLKEREILLKEKELATKNKAYKEALLSEEKRRKSENEKKELLIKLKEAEEKLKETEERKKELDFLDGADEETVKLLSKLEAENAVLKEKLSDIESRKTEAEKLERELAELENQMEQKKTGGSLAGYVIAAILLLAGISLGIIINLIFLLLCVPAIAVAIISYAKSLPSEKDKENEKKREELLKIIEKTKPDLNEENEILKSLESVRVHNDEIFDRYNVHSQAELIKKLSERETIDKLLRAAENECHIIKENIKKSEINEKESEKTDDVSSFSDEVKNYSGRTAMETEQLLSALQSKLIMTEKALSEAETTISAIAKDEKSSAELLTEIGINEKEADELQKVYDATDKALQMIEESYEILKSDFAPLLSEKVKDAAIRLTDGKYTDIRISDDYTLKVETEGDIADAGYLSGGTYDALYLALRMGILKILFDDKLSFLILDDAFLQFDDKRADCAASYLKEEKLNQLIYLTCHKNQSELFGRENVNIINL